MPAWVQSLPKEQVAQLLAQHNLDSEGTLKVLRRRLRQFISQNPDSLLTTPAGTAAMPKPDIEDRPGTPPVTMLERTKILNQIRKWGQQFDGKDPLSFLERIEELRRGYGYDDEQLLLGLPELLKEDALLWYRNHRESWSTWEEFCQGLRT
jgi:hypothetical protein